MEKMIENCLELLCHLWHICYFFFLYIF